MRRRAAACGAVRRDRARVPLTRRHTPLAAVRPERPSGASGSARVAGVSTVPPALRPVVREELAQLCASERLARSATLVRLLRHVVERHLQGDAAALRETTIALEVFGRDPRRYDAQVDPIVRVASRRLREQLGQHYARPGTGARLRIVLPKGRYVPEYVVRADTAPGLALAVRPVRNLAGDPALDDFCRRFADLVAARLARSGVAEVGSAGDPAAAWRLEAVLARDVQPDGLRMSVRVVRAADGTVAWTTSRALPAAQRMRLAEVLAGRVAARLGAFRSPAVETSVDALADDDGAPVPRAALDAVRLLVAQDDAAAAGEALARSSGLVASHPRSAEAWACHASALHAGLAHAERGADVLRVRLRAAAAHAFALDPSDADALRVQALVAARLDLRIAAATGMLERALRIAPHHALARLEYAEVLRLAGEHERALAEIDLALAHAPMAQAVRLARARHLEWLHRFDEARNEWSLLRASGEQTCAFATGTGHLEARAGRLDEARAYARAAAARFPGRPEPVVLAATIEALAGRVAAARALDASLDARFPRHPRAPRAVLAALLRDRDAVLAHVAAASDGVEAGLPAAVADPWLAWLADDAGFLALLRRLGLPRWPGRVPAALRE